MTRALSADRLFEWVTAVAILGGFGLVVGQVVSHWDDPSLRTIGLQVVLSLVLQAGTMILLEKANTLDFRSRSLLRSMLIFQMLLASSLLRHVEGR